MLHISQVGISLFVEIQSCANDLAQLLPVYDNPSNVYSSSPIQMGKQTIYLTHNMANLFFFFCHKTVFCCSVLNNTIRVFILFV